MSFAAEHAAHLARCENTLQEVAAAFFKDGSVVSRAAQYTLMNGGKRVRGILVQAVCDMLGGDAAVANRFAAAIEMVHAFSLVHDDLPCMDDDDMRRGKPSAHVAFGEANALLAGDLLAIEAFGVLCSAPADADRIVRACKVLSQASGAKGMIFGQELDLQFENQPAGLDDIKRIQKFKTGALILAAVQLGVVAAGADESNVAELTKYGQNIGAVFQIIDDILDVTADAEQLGKPIGSDAQQGKNTHVTLLGVEQSKTEAARLTQEANDGIRNKYGPDSDFLCEYSNDLLERIS